MIGPVSTSAGGMMAASQRFADAAQDVARLGTGLPDAAQIDLSSAAQDLIVSKAAFSLNVAILRSTMESERRVLDILA